MVEEEEQSNATVTAVTLCTRAPNGATRGVPDACPRLPCSLHIYKCWIFRQNLMDFDAKPLL